MTAGQRFGRFVKPARPSKSREQRLEETMLMAFGQGEAACRRRKPRSANPYDRAAQPDSHAAWELGYSEQEGGRAD